MTDLSPIPEWTGVYEIKTTDKVLGGPGGVTNIPAQALANQNLYARKHGGALPFMPGIPYDEGDRVKLTNGDIVKSTIANNIINPNVDMTGWVNPAALQALHNKSSATFTDYLTANEIANSATTDLTAKLQAVIDAGVVSTLRFTKGKYRIDGLVTVNRDFFFDQDIDAWFDTGNTGSFLCTGSAQLLGKPTIDIAEQSKTIGFADTSAINEYDLLCIYNPTNSSFSARELWYRAGEFVKVASKNANSFSLFGKTFDAYLANEVDVYKINPITVGFSRFNIISSNAGLRDPIKFTFCENLDLSNYNNLGSKNSGIILDRCYNTTMPNIMAKNNSTPNGLNYGIVIANSQLFRLNGGNPLALRHCISTGGYDGICSVPCREIYISNMSLKTSSKDGIGAADFHANISDSHYENCIIDHGSFGGKNISIRNCTVFNRDIDGSCLIFQGLVGGEINIENVKLQTTIASSSARSYIDITLLEDLKEDLVINIKDLRVFGKVSSTSPMIKLVTEKTVVLTKKITFNIEVDSYITQNGAFLWVQGGAAQPILPNVEINMLRANSITKNVYYVHPTTTATAATTKLNLPRQRGSQLITTAGEVTGIKHGDLITLPYSYPVQASVIASVGGDGTWNVDSTFNLKPVTATPYGSMTTQVRFALVSPAALPAAKNFKVSYEIGL